MSFRLCSASLTDFTMCLSAWLARRQRQLLSFGMRKRTPLTPERGLLKCVLGHLVRKGLARSDLLAEFKRLIPDHQLFFDPPGASDSATWGRADTGRRGGKYANENPDVHPLTRPYRELA